MKHYLSVFALALSIVACVSTADATSASSLADKCTDDFNKVVPCLTYATGKGSTPGKECCDSVDEIKTKDPVCLCYFMEQTLNGSEEVKSLGLHKDRLLQLPSACKLTNASVSYCPKLLNIPVNSPEYKMFTNISSAIASSPPTSTTPSGGEASLPITTNTKSSGPMFGPQVAQLAGPITIAVALFLLV